MQAFAQFGSDLDANTKSKLERGRRIVELFKQGQYAPKSLGIEVVNLYAIQKGYLDDVPVERIFSLRNDMEEDVQTNHRDLLALIEEKRELTPEVDEALASYMKQFKSRIKK